MLEKKIIDNGITYQLVGKIYYPVILGAQLPLGFYGSKRVNYLIEHNKIHFTNEYSHNRFHTEMFCFNCYCEHLFQKLFFECLDNYPKLTNKQIKEVQKQLKEYILNKYVLQSREVIYNGKELEITK